MGTDQEKFKKWAITKIKNQLDIEKIHVDLKKSVLDREKIKSGREKVKGLDLEKWSQRSLLGVQIDLKK